MADLNYVSSKTRRGRVIENGKICPTLTTENIPNVIEEWTWRGDERGIYEHRCEKILQVLWKRDDDEEILKWAIRGSWCVLAKEILRQNVYAKRLFEEWKAREELVLQCPYNIEDYERNNFTEDRVRDLWEEWKIGCPSYRWGLDEQSGRELEGVMSELSYEGTSSQSLLQSMWKTYEGVGVLQQALSSIQEIWESDGSEEAQWYLIRIRKLSPIECWRLMAFTDEDFHKAESVNSNTQLYKQAGNSIVVSVLEGIFRGLM